MERHYRNSLGLCRGLDWIGCSRTAASLQLCVVCGVRGVLRHISDLFQSCGSQESQGFGHGLTAEAVADPGFGQDVLRFCGIGLDLLSKMSNEDPQVVGLVAVIWAPHGLKQFSVRYGFPGVR